MTLLIGVVTSSIAMRHKRSGIIWFLAGILFGWVALLFSLFLPLFDRSKKKEEEVRKQEKKPPLIDFEQKKWFYLTPLHEQLGPILYEELKNLWNQQSITENSLVWQEGMQNWMLIRDLPHLLENIKTK